MKAFGLNNIVKGEKEEYHIETSFHPESFSIVNKILRGGAILSVEKIPVAKDANEKNILEYIRNLHTLKLNELSKWLKIGEKAIEGPSEMNVKLGRKFLFMGLIDKAEEHFRRAMEKDPEYHASYGALGRLFYIKKEYEKAMRMTAKAIEKSPQYLYYYILMGKILYKLDKNREAQRFIEEALKRNPASAEAHYILSKILLKEYTKGNTSITKEKIIAEVKSLLILDPRIKSKEYDNTVICLEQEKCEDALLEMEKLEQSFDSELIQEFATDILLLSKFEKDNINLTISEYILRLQELLEENSNSPELHHELGRVFVLKIKELLEKSLFHFKKTLALDSHYPDIQKKIELLENEIQGFLLLLKAMER